MLRRRYAPAFLFTLLLLALPACDSSGGDEEESEFSVQGYWESERITVQESSGSDTFVIRLDIDQNGDDVSGTGELQYVEGEAGELDLSFDGSYAAPDLDITATFDEANEDDPALGFSCDVQSETAMECDLSSGGVTQETDVFFMKEG